MIEQQHPVGSGFRTATTASEVLAGLDLTGHHVVVTGGHGRLGLEVTRSLAVAGATVTVASRDVARASAVVAGIPRVQVEHLDLTDPGSVDSFTARWNASGRPLQALVANAAVLFSLERRLDARGNELAFSTSHLGHFQLAQGLLPALRSAGGARVVTVTSGAARIGAIRWNDPTFAHGYDAGAAYAQSKRANVLFSVAFDLRHAAEGIRATAAHPGVVIGPGPHRPDRVAAYREQGLVDEHGATVIDPERGTKTIEQGAATLVFGAVHPALDGVGGVYLKDSEVAVIDDEVRPLTAQRIPADANSAMLDPDDAERLWRLSEVLTARR
ncbi:SDR family NAD(P)-dependent oxidoreductase [Curtobacterium sp. MCBA15_001]|uniref:SDR family NAD(P)-dependent oxidoreductase n=1 Tax=Curtobacterium sp. MCBA15_001 TaxID=1898731 RepID=UPI0008DE4DCA|nr:SDR family NAD(P)-dependent oxidoreductase [Curtobacterium sp. MCBA15_001]OIH94437.1 oxidoreductase [Curtobacterium sp. MCBA15_001]